MYMAPTQLPGVAADSRFCAWSWLLLVLLLLLLLPTVQAVLTGHVHSRGKERRHSLSPKRVISGTGDRGVSVSVMIAIMRKRRIHAHGCVRACMHPPAHPRIQLPSQ